MSFIKVETKKLPNSDSTKTNSLELSKRLTHAMYLNTMEVFDQEGPGWKPLSARTKKQRVREGFGEAPILDRKRGNLGLRGGVIESPSNTEAVVGIRAGIKYALIHQFGGAIKRVTQPGTVRLRTNRKGELMRQTDYKNLAVFGKKKHKQVKEVKKSFGRRYTIYIAKRKYLFFDKSLIDKLKTIALEFLNGK